MAHGATIQFYRGAEAGIPTLAAGEPGFTTDTYKLFVGDGVTNHEIGGGSSYTTENAQDDVGGILTDSSTIDFTYDDGAPSITAAARVQMSITSDSSGLKLDGDAASPGASQYYGTNGIGTKGYHSFPAVVVPDADYGQITVSSSGTVWTVDNATITLMHLADLTTTSRLIGSGSAGNTVSEITLGSGLSMSGTTLSSTGYTSGGTDVALADGGTGASLSDPNADRILFWDDSAGQVTWLEVNGMSFVGTSLRVDYLTSHRAMIARSTAQSISNSTLTKVNLNLEVYDVGGIADPTTQYRFDIATTGYYFIHAAWQSGGTPTLSIAYIYVNGTAIASSVMSDASAGSTVSNEVSALRSLTAGDYVEMYVYQTSGSSQNTETAVDQRPRMSIFEIPPQYIDP